VAQRTFEDIKKRIAAVTAEIAKLQLEYTKLKNAGKSAEEIQKELGNKFSTLTKKLTTLTNVTKQYNKQSNTTAKEAKSVNRALNNTTTKYTELSGSINKATIANQKLAQSSRATAASNKTLGESFNRSFTQGTLGRIAAYLGIYQLLYAAIGAVKDITFGSIKVFIDFQERLGRLGAVTGATAEELKSMESAIRQVAVQTKFTAEETGALAVSLAKLGVASYDIPKFLAPVALAAQATGESLEKTGEAIIKVNNQFGLSASESASTAATLVSAINDSALSLNTFNTAIQYVGPIADQVGLTFEQTSAYMKELADNGFTASRIGTGLRSIFIELKKSGEPLNETLKNLAAENISVAEATDLVGKRAAAQLLSILRNIDAIEKQTSVEEQLTTTLKASSAEMSTVAGQLKILSSAYNELQISIGQALTSSDLLLDLIGLLSSESEQLARGYQLLNRVTTESSEVFKNELSEAVTGNSNAFEVLKKSVESLNDADLNEFISLLESKAYVKNLDDVILRLNIIARSPSAFSGQKDAANQFLGAIKQIQSAIGQELMAKEVRDARNDIIGTYQPEIDAIEKIGNLKQRDLKFTEAQDKLQKKLEDTRKKLEDARFAEVRDDSSIRKLEGEQSAYQRLISDIADLSEGIEEKIKKSQEAAKAQFKLDSDEIKRREAQIKDELKRIKSIRDARVKEAEERAKLERAAAQTVEARAEAEIRLNNSIAAANADAKDMTSELILDINELANKSADLANVYKDGEFSGAISQLSDSVNNLFEDFFSLQNQIKITFSEQALDYASDAKGVVQEYGEELGKLKEKFGENADANRDYINEANLLTDVTIENLKNLLSGIDLTSQEGQLLKQIIDEQIATLDNARPKYEEIGEFIREQLFNSFEDAAQKAIKALERFNDVAYENTKDRLDREKDLIEARFQTEEDILKSQLDNQLITEEEYRNRQLELRKKQIGQENAIDKALFDADQKRDRQQALSDYLQALASTLINEVNAGRPFPENVIAAGITAGLSSASYGAELSAISKRKFFPKKFAEGGVVNGPSHAEGGVPFTVQGRGGYEMEGGEFIVNKRAAQLHRSVLERINNSTKPIARTGKYNYGNESAIRKFAQGGLVNAQSQLAQSADEQLEYLKAIAAATTTTAVGVSKPVRAYVTSADLNNNDSERKIKERNTLI